MNYSKSTRIKCHIVQAVCGLLMFGLAYLSCYLWVALFGISPDPRDNEFGFVPLALVCAGLGMIFSKKLWIVDVINFFDK